jgi:ubiquinone/menaquinone biosynthesis C-methylase UbiE
MRVVSVEEGYARWAPTYDDDPNPVVALEERHLRPLLPVIAGRRVLDLACGTGRWLQYLAPQGPRSIAGIDFSHAMLREAMRKVGVNGKLFRAHGAHAPFESGRFDLVLCSFAFAHFRNPLQVTMELARVCARGADVFVTDLHIKSRALGWKTAFRDTDGPAEIQAWPLDHDAQAEVWRASNFRLVKSFVARIDEPEIPILARARIAHKFDEVRRVPAIQIDHLKLH